jgi:hypothetical protein
MAEPRQITFAYTELAEMLIKKQGIHEGLWGVYVELGIGGANVNPVPEADAVPAAIVPLVRMGIQKFDVEVKGITVDAAVVNPAPEAAQRAADEEAPDQSGA